MHSFLELRASHNIADGYSFFPLLRDLDNILAGNDLGPVADGLKVLDARLYETLVNEPGPARMSLRSNFDHYRGSGYNHNIVIDEHAFASLRSIGLATGVPVDHQLLAFVLLTRARCHSSPAPMHVVLYVPMRDGLGEVDCVGLFSDWRTFVVQFPENSTVFGAVMRIRDLVRRRKFQVYDPFTRSQDMLVNFLHIDRQQRHVLKQYRDWEFGELRKRSTLSHTHQPIAVSMEEEENRWWVGLKFDYELYPPVYCRRFLRTFETIVQEFRETPYTPLYI
jgi:hypothetical protein